MVGAKCVLERETKMRLMISVISESEAAAALSGGADILDIKNPREGSLGAQHPDVVRRIKAIAPDGVSVSAAIGDMPHLPGTAALAALGAASCGVDFIKVGVYGSQNAKDAEILLREVQQAVNGFHTSVIAAAYADYRRAGTLNPESLPEISAAAGIAGCLLDTLIKDGQGLFRFLSADIVKNMAEQSHAHDLLFGLAGSLRERDLRLARKAGADVAGIRTAVCRDNHRKGPLEEHLVRQLIQSIRPLSCAATDDA
jgi:uncharacterized protein (UPF0264 family)